jgi:pimeloyl-ACP methyl ester carboxylesterase
VRDTAPPEAWIDWGGSGTPAVFGHANGFPPESYRLLLEELGRCFSVASFAARPLWPGSDPGSARSWRDLAGDLGDELRRRRVEGLLAVGHSLGSVLNVLAAAAEPRRFRALALVEPVVFTGAHTLFWGALRGLGFGRRLPLIRGALRRRESYADLQEVRASYAGKSIFATWNPQALDDYIGAAFVPDPTGGVRLRYPKVWEARIFELTPATVWRELKSLEVPMLFIRGGASDTFVAAAAKRADRELKTAKVVEVAGAGHFVPMERPFEVARLIVDWARRVGI